MTRKRIRGSADVAQLLRESIQSGEFRSHQMLPSERKLAEQFGVSRGTIRVALAELAAANLVTTKRSHGTFVHGNLEAERELAIESIRPLELIDARFALEPHICRLAAINARKSDLSDLNVLLLAMEAQVADRLRFSELDAQFHTRLAETTGNQCLAWVSSQIERVRFQKEWTRMRYLTLDPPMIAIYNEQHRSVVESIEGRSPDAAATAMQVHLESARTSLLRAASR